MLCMKKVWLPHLDLTGEFAALARRCGHALPVMHRRILMKKERKGKEILDEEEYPEGFLIGCLRPSKNPPNSKMVQPQEG